MGTVSTMRPSQTSDVDWWFGRLGTGGSQPRDTIITDVIGPLVQEARSQGLLRWRFTWHQTATKTSLMLALLGTARVGRLLPTSWTTADDRSGTLVSWPQGGQETGVSSSDLAASFEELGCDLAVWASRSLSRETTRAALGALLLHDAAHTLMSWPVGLSATDHLTRSWREYWDRHKATWAHRDDAVAPTLLALDLHAPATYSLEPHVATLRADPVSTGWRTRWSRGLEHLLARSQDLNLPTSPTRLALIHSHLLLNRLGFLPHEESLLGEVARSFHPGGSLCLGAGSPTGGEIHEHTH